MLTHTTRLLTILIITAAFTATASEPASHEVSIPTTPGQTVTVQWTGTIQPGVFDGTICSLNPSSGGQVDRIAITLLAPEPFSAAVNIISTIRIEWDDGVQDLGLELTRDGNSIGYSGGIPNEEPGYEEIRVRYLEADVYEVATCTAVVTTPTAYRGRLTLEARGPAGLTAPSVPAPAPGEPRYQQQYSSAGLGDGTVGEMNIGYNPHTGRYLLLHLLQTLRMTLAEDLQDPVEPPLKLPENCPALWEDVSFASTSVETQDPILSTDPQTGRTFVSQLLVTGGGDSIYAFSDDDGDTWTQGTLTVAGGHDHQTLVSGPYVAGRGPLPSANGYPNAVTYCSAEPAAFATCIRSDDGGLSFGPPAPVASVADCSDFFGLLGHLRYGADGTMYVPNKQCNGHEAIAVSEDSGDSFEVRENPNANSGETSHGAVAVSRDGGTLYHCYVNADGEIHVSVSHDKARTWDNDSDIGAAAGITQGVFPALVAGDADRATCGFVGTTVPGNYQAVDFAGIWHVYMATTYDGGKSWRTVIASPGNPVQGLGGICTSGAGCGDLHRNLLDFNEVVMNQNGYPIYAYTDGCIGPCDADPSTATTYFAKAAFTRQVGGRGLLAQFDPVEPAAPQRTCLSGARSQAGSTLTWPAADSSGNEVTGYKVLRGKSLETLGEIATLGELTRYTDAQAEPGTPYYYKVIALNSSGESQRSNAVLLQPSDLILGSESSCSLPGVTLLSDTSGDAVSTQPAHDILMVSAAEPAELPGKIALTIKVADLSSLPPNTLWVVRFHSPTLPATGLDWFVGMHTGFVTPTFVYGTVNEVVVVLDVATTYTYEGEIDAASNYDPDGTITLIADKSLFGLGDGVTLSNLLAAARLITSPALPSAGGDTVMDNVLGGAYVIAGNLPCSATAAPSRSAVATGSAVEGRFGGSISGSMLLFLLLLAAPRAAKRRAR